jgi:5'-deoxynucleotidase
MKESHFLATVSRMKYIERWALMRNSRPENLSEHACEVAMIANLLCVIGNVRYGRDLDAEKAAAEEAPAEEAAAEEAEEAPAEEAAE